LREQLRVSRVTVKGGCRVVLEGVIDERANLKKHLEGLSGAVVLDLDKVSRITSFGVLEWRSALKQLEAGYVAFIRCRPMILGQFNMVDGFGGRGELVSFYLPYICSACSHEFELLVDLRHHYSIAVSREPPHALCRKCGAEAEFEGLPDEYLSYVGSKPRPHVPPIALQMIDGVVGDVVERLKVKKEIDGRVTSITLNGPLTGDARLNSATEGVEGFLVVDLADVTSIDEGGMRALASSVSRLAVVQCCYAKVPFPLLDSFASNYQRTLPAEGICSIVLHDHCPKCRSNSDFELTIHGLAGDHAEARCGTCRSRVPIRIPDANLRKLREILIEPASEIDHSLTARKAVNPSLEGPAPPMISQLSIVGESSAFREIVETLRKVAPTNATVLIRGETGTGKEMLARLVHDLSPRRDKPFVAINCAALSESLMESELFGHERGAFTGATEQTLGRFERAHGGTLFIDEIGDLPGSVQVKLLRALQEKCIERVGGSEPIPIDIRMVAATHRSLEQMMEKGEFREDLFFRISVVPVFVPPLRQRPTDIWPIALHYLGEIQKRSGRNGIRFSERMRRALEEYSWPGNIRELINVVERAVALTPSQGTADLIDFASKPFSTPTPAMGTAVPAAPSQQPQEAALRKPLDRDTSLKEAVDAYERKLIQEALDRAHGNRTHAARELGISRQALGLKITKYGL
jgi:DNA-binding NtrC family response regulator/anti-anti-sigma regulatory factor